MTFKEGDRVHVRSKHIEGLEFEGDVHPVGSGIIHVELDGHRFAIAIVADDDDWLIEPVKPKITFGPGASLYSPVVGGVTRKADGTWSWTAISSSSSAPGDDFWADMVAMRGIEVLTYGVGGGIE